MLRPLAAGAAFSAASVLVGQSPSLFGEPQPLTSAAAAAECVYAADVDGDGDMDVLSASFNDDKIAWYENVDGQGTFGVQRVITTAADGARSVYAADVDGDGDMDALSASSVDDRIAWYENVDGQGTFGAPQLITAAAVDPWSVYATDVDGDGDMDVLSASAADDTIAWYENVDGQGTFGVQQVITAAANGARSVYTADVDGDGDMDVLSASDLDDTVAWFENVDGQGTFGAERVITAAADGARSVYATDMDGDGDIDVLSASARDDTIAWYKNVDGLGTFGAQQVIATPAPFSNPVNGARSVYAADVDGDGDMDVLSASSANDRIAWYENVDGQGTFGGQRVISSAANNARSVYAADVDGDGDTDVLSASLFDNKVAWYENLDGLGAFGVEQVITKAASGARSVYAADLDGDGDMDALSASYADDKIAWYENVDGLGTFGAQQVITRAADGAQSVYAADVDGDGDMDVLSASYADDKVAWYENVDGQGTFGVQQVITAAANGARSVYTADVDGDGDMDVLSASDADDTIAWYENVDGQGTFGAERVITAAADGACSVYATDMDGDGDMDVLSASLIDNTIAWYENVDGQGTFGSQQVGSQQVITTAAIGAASVYATDVDGDGDMDVLSASSVDAKIAWYENVDGQGTFGSQQVITVAADGAESVHAADVDGDGDMDVLSASSANNRIAWYENVDGQGTFGPQQAITSGANVAWGVYATDVDGDGDMDVLSASRGDSKVAYYENLRTERLGAGCAGLLLTADAPMRVGVASTVTLDGVPSVGPGGLFFLGTQAQASPLALNGACTAYIVPDLHYYLMPAPQGRAQLTIPVPSNAALVGAAVAVQGTARSLHPAAWRRRWAVSNGLLYTVGN